MSDNDSLFERHARWMAASAPFAKPIALAKQGLDRMGSAITAFVVLGLCVAVNLIAMPAGAPLIVMPGDAYQPTVTDSVTTTLGIVAFLNCLFNLFVASASLRAAKRLSGQALGAKAALAPPEETLDRPSPSGAPIDKPTLKAAIWLAKQAVWRRG